MPMPDEGGLETDSFMVGACRVTGASHLIERGGESIRVEARTMQLLLCLAEHPGEVVRREAIEARLWPRVVVGYDALTQAVAKLRKALGDDGHHCQLIETVPKSGYRLLAAVRRPGATGAARADAAAIAGNAPLPSIAVMPFADMGHDPDLAYFSDGITEDIITELARCPDLRVVARHSCFSYKGKPLVVDQLRKELGVRYVLEGSVRRSGNKVRITAQLVDTVSGHDVWANLFDEEAADLFALQDMIRKRIIGAIVGEEGEVRKSDSQRAWAKPSASLDEYDYYLRVHHLIFRFTKHDNARARAVAREALVQFPAASLIKVKLGWAYMLDARFGWSADAGQDIESAGALADEGLADVNLHPYGQAVAHWLKAYAYLYHRRDFDLAIAEAERATSLAPNDTDLLASLSLVFVYCGLPDKGLELMQRAIELEPRMPPFFNRFLGWVYYHLERYPEAANCARTLTLISLETLRLQAASYARLGLAADALAIAARLRELDPKLCLTGLRAQLPYRHPADLEREIAGLRTAGVPEQAPELAH